MEVFAHCFWFCFHLCLAMYGTDIIVRGYGKSPFMQSSLYPLSMNTAANPLLYHISSFRAVIQIIGCKRLLYGSDFPLLLYPSKNREMDFSMFVTQIQEEAGLAPAEWDRIMGENLKELLKIKS